MILDDIRARYPDLAGALYFFEPGRPVTLELITPAGDTFPFTAPTVAECIAKAFPEMQPEPTEPEPALSRETTMRVVASLAAAISLLERSPKKAAASNKMFDQMLTDYRNALDAARAELNSEPTEPEPEEPAASVFD